MGEDIWKDLDGRVVIQDNVAQDQAAQFNYPISLEALKVVMGAHGNNMKAMSALRRRKRRDSAQEKDGDDTSSGES